jgi:hypothetical protein
LVTVAAVVQGGLVHDRSLGSVGIGVGAESESLSTDDHLVVALCPVEVDFEHAIPQRNLVARAVEKDIDLVALGFGAEADDHTALLLDDGSRDRVHDDRTGQRRGREQRDAQDDPNEQTPTAVSRGCRTDPRRHGCTSLFRSPLPRPSLRDPDPFKNAFCEAGGGT